MELSDACAAQYHGVIKWFNQVLGYGFITCPDGRDIFLPIGAVVAARYAPEHFSKLKHSRITFTIEQDGQGRDRVRHIFQVDDFDCRPLLRLPVGAVVTGTLQGYLPTRNFGFLCGYVNVEEGGRPFSYHKVFFGRVSARRLSDDMALADGQSFRFLVRDSSGGRTEAEVLEYLALRDGEQLPVLTVCQENLSKPRNRVRWIRRARKVRYAIAAE